MQLRHGKRAVKHEPVNHVRHLAKPAADSAAKLSAAVNHKTLFVALLFGGFAHCSPKRKRFARADDNSVYLCGGKSNVRHLILLKAHIHALEAAYQNGGMPLHHVRQKVAAFLRRKLFAAKKVLDFTDSAALPHGDFIAGRAYIAKKFSSHGGRLLFRIFYHIFLPLSLWFSLFRHLFLFACLIFRHIPLFDYFIYAQRGYNIQ